MNCKGLDIEIGVLDHSECVEPCHEHSTRDELPLELSHAYPVCFIFKSREIFRKTFRPALCKLVRAYYAAFTVIIQKAQTLGKLLLIGKNGVHKYITPLIILERKTVDPVLSRAYILCVQFEDIVILCKIQDLQDLDERPYIVTGILHIKEMSIRLEFLDHGLRL